MIKKLSLYSAGILAFILIAIYYNYTQAQKAIRETKPSVLETTVTSYPEIIQSGRTGTYIWHVNVPNDLSTTFTTIYWGSVSTPSAVTVNDPPQSLGYPNSTNDYRTGQFKLPDDFDSQITFDQPGKIYFRSYAKVGNLHIWSEEYTTNVVAKF